MQNSSNIEKVLVVVDFQNCFISGGSFGYHSLKKQDFNDSMKQTFEIEKLINVNDNIIFTRDYHPIGHRSIGNNKEIKINYDTTWPSHCLNIKSTCPKNITNNYSNTNSSILEREYITVSKFFDKPEVKNNSKSYLNKLSNKDKFLTNFGNKSIIGTQLSFTLYFTKYGNIISELVELDKPIGITSKKSVSPNYNTTHIAANTFQPIMYYENRRNTGSNIVNTTGRNIVNTGRNIVNNIGNTGRNTVNNIGNTGKNSMGKKFIQLVKGQLCNYESYSAFNYHLRIVPGNNNNQKKTFKSEYITKEYDDSGKISKLSTGLFEYILKCEKTNIEITVCGLVGDVCVLYTVIEGLIMWNKYYINNGSGNGMNSKNYINNGMNSKRSTGNNTDIFSKEGISNYNNNNNNNNNNSKNVIFNYSLCGTKFTGIDFLGFTGIFPNITDFPRQICIRLNNLDIPIDYKEFICFNVLDYDGNLLGTVLYDNNDDNFVFSWKKI